MKRIRFKSTPENWIKEFTGRKPNTVRFTDDWDSERYELYEEAIYIEIENTKTKDVFTRKIVDKTEYEGLVVISWKDK